MSPAGRHSFLPAEGVLLRAPHPGLHPNRITLQGSSLQYHTLETRAPTYEWGRGTVHRS